MPLKRAEWVGINGVRLKFTCDKFTTVKIKNKKGRAKTLNRVANNIIYNTMSDFKERLKTEAQELAEKTNKLNDFMRTQAFVDLDRENKDLLYAQSRLMNEYLQILGQRLELLGDKFSFKE